MLTASDSLPPVLLLGMHRSGTSLLSRMLSELGLFVGEDLQDDHEPVFFIRGNNWLLRQGQATWDYPVRFRSAVADPSFRTRLVERLPSRLTGKRLCQYIGARHEREFRQHHALSFPWGWKDPRNTYTLPVWREIYPEARIIHITRHVVDVAHSLVLRERPAWQQMKSWVKAATLVWPRDADGKRVSPTRCTTLHGAFSLWEEYMCEARRDVSELGNRACEVSYEAFLEEPVPVLEKLCHFIGLPFETGRITHGIRSIDRHRAYAYRRDPGLSAYADSVRGRLTEQGY